MPQPQPQVYSNKRTHSQPLTPTTCPHPQVDAASAAVRAELQRVWDASAGPYRGLLRCVYDPVNKACWLAPARPKQVPGKALMDALGLSNPHDRNGKVLRDRLCSAALEDALAEYRWAWLLV